MSRRKLRILAAGLEKISLFCDPVISRPQARFRRKFCNVYATIYGNSVCYIYGILCKFSP